MQAILMRHPTKGTMVLYTKGEIDFALMNGWSFVNRPKSAPPLVMREAAGGTVDAPVPIEEQYFRKFGKRPHHRMKRQTIELALKDE